VGSPLISTGNIPILGNQAKRRIVHDGTTFLGLQDSDKGRDCAGKAGGREVRYHARFVIGADGPKSAVTKTLYPDYRKSIPWFMVGQKFQNIIECPLDRDYFHFWFHPGLGDTIPGATNVTIADCWSCFPSGAIFTKPRECRKYLEGKTRRETRTCGTT